MEDSEFKQRALNGAQSLQRYLTTQLKGKVDKIIGISTTDDVASIMRNFNIPVSGDIVYIIANKDIYNFCLQMIFHVAKNRPPELIEPSKVLGFLATSLKNTKFMGDISDIIYKLGLFAPSVPIVPKAVPVLPQKEVQPIDPMPIHNQAWGEDAEPANKRRRQNDVPFEYEEDENMDEEGEISDSEKIGEGVDPSRLNFPTRFAAVQKFFYREVAKVRRSIEQLTLSKVVEVPDKVDELLTPLMYTFFLDLVDRQGAEIVVASRLTFDKSRCRFSDAFEHAARVANLVEGADPLDEPNLEEAKTNPFDFLSAAIAPAMSVEKEELSLGSKAARFLISRTVQCEVTTRATFLKNQKFCKYNSQHLESFQTEILSSYGSSRPIGNLINKLFEWIVVNTVISVLRDDSKEQEVFRDSMLNTWASYFVNDRLVIERSYPKHNVVRHTPEFSKKLASHPKLKPKKADLREVLSVHKVSINIARATLSTKEADILRELNISFQTVSQTVKPATSLFINERRLYVQGRINNLQAKAKKVTEYLALRKGEMHGKIIAKRKKTFAEAKEGVLENKEPITTEEWRIENDALKLLMVDGTDLINLLITVGLIKDDKKLMVYFAVG